MFALMRRRAGGRLTGGNFASWPDRLPDRNIEIGGPGVCRMSFASGFASCLPRSARCSQLAKTLLSPV
eukprot:6388562-Lingulodinium_polyedra.AAC.1